MAARRPARCRKPDHGLQARPRRTTNKTTRELLCQREGNVGNKMSDLRRVENPCAQSASRRFLQAACQSHFFWPTGPGRADMILNRDTLLYDLYARGCADKIGRASCRGKSVG